MTESRECGEPSSREPRGMIVARGQPLPAPVRALKALDQPLRLFGGEGAGPPHQVGLGQILRLKWTILAVLILVAAPMIAVIWTLSVPKYSARGEIRVRPFVPSLVFRMEDNGMIPLYQSYKDTQVALIVGPRVLQRVLDREDVQKTVWYTDPDVPLLGTQLTPLERLRDALYVVPRGRTEIIDVAMMARKSSEAALIANAVLDFRTNTVCCVMTSRGGKRSWPGFKRNSARPRPRNWSPGNG